MTESHCNLIKDSLFRHSPADMVSAIVLFVFNASTLYRPFYMLIPLDSCQLADLMRNCVTTILAYIFEHFLRSLHIFADYVND